MIYYPYWQLIFILLAFNFAGCASSPWARADCLRIRQDRWNVLACSDAAVAGHCKRICPTDDFGRPINYYPRACQDWFRGKPVIFIGRSHMGCLPHEICHVEHPDDDAMCAAKYPCVQDVK